MKSIKGFTLIELIIVIVIIGILTVVALPIYRGYVKKAMATEGKSLLGTVLTAQKLYFSEFNHFVAGDESLLLGVDPIANKYFTTFTLSGDNAGFTATTAGSGNATGISLTLTGSSSVSAQITESGM
ncbi:MAG: prepilin-type N-terminal cleavage/methylation domain-containing protein [Endomicrobiaceae bacterium]|nr:prepilin-type N-terminal cleavage/methylation domain-containing protein [Endomicrobiaceae bacterium]